MALGLLMPFVAGGIALAWWRKWLPARAFLLAVLLQAVLLISGIVAMQAGEVEEERVEQVVPERFIEEHEEAASLFVWASGAALGLMLLSFVTSRRRLGLPLAAAATLSTLLVSALGYRTGQAGGELVYRHGAASAYGEPVDPSPSGQRTRSEPHED